MHNNGEIMLRCVTNNGQQKCEGEARNLWKRENSWNVYNMQSECICICICGMYIQHATKMLIRLRNWTTSLEMIHSHKCGILLSPGMVLSTRLFQTSEVLDWVGDQHHLSSCLLQLILDWARLESWVGIQWLAVPTTEAVLCASVKKQNTVHTTLALDSWFGSAWWTTGLFSPALLHGLHELPTGWC